MAFSINQINYMLRVNKKLKIDKIRLQKEKDILSYQLDSLKPKIEDTPEKRSRLFGW
ncbi:MAG: hypothetical protein QNJ72_18610 [Pleurocapsa sp. MO_226.B13]|nr:hypothetical protein [Pleurocapsa sp. MO_226.B13]